jgi:hypothetical protein
MNMFTEEMRNKWYDLFSREIQGGSSNDMWTMVEVWIDDGVITTEEYHDHEGAICALFDANWFTCEGCGWTLPIEEMAESGDGWHCEDCDKEGDSRA